MMLLFTRRWREESRSLLSWILTISIVTYLALLLSMLFVNTEEIARVFTEWMSKAPPVLRSMVGGDMLIFSNPGSFVAGMVFNTILPALVLVYVCLSAISIYSNEADHGNLEFLFSLPINRLHLVVGRILVFLGNLAIVHVAIFISAFASMITVGEAVAPARLALGMYNQYLLFAAIGGLVFLFSLAVKERNKVLLISLAAFFGLFVMNIFMETKQQLPDLLRLAAGVLQGGESPSQHLFSLFNPYYYYNAAQILTQGLMPWWNGAVLAAFTLIFWGWGSRVYVRKQV